MKKYLAVFTTTVKEYVAYRLNFVLWRLRMFLGTLMIFFLWSSVLETTTGFGHYGKSQLLSYILYANLVGNFILGTRTADIANDINSGNIINQILKPFPFFGFHLIRDLADKSLNVVFAFIEVGLLVFFFQAPLLSPQNLPLFLLFFIAGTLISFFINLMLSFIGFWTTEVWAPRFIFLMLIFYLSGSFFPLDLLPKPVYYFLLALPFPYLYYLPTKILIGQIDNLIYVQLAMAGLWTLLTARLAYLMWTKGNKSFSFWGR
jgi:ABC-2 type transport system permease protein